MNFLQVVVLFMPFDISLGETNKLKVHVEDDLEVSESDKPIYEYIPATHTNYPLTQIRYHLVADDDPSPEYSVPQVKPPPPYSDPNQEHHLSALLASDPLLAAFYLSGSLGIPSRTSRGFNHPQHLPINPYVALLLSHYGRYVNVPGQRGTARGIYGYSAANNYHNNKPFGSYKIYERD